MEIHEIEVTIENGHVGIAVRGVQGQQCLALTKDLEDALGGQVVSRQMTPEAYELLQAEIPDCKKVRGQ